MPIFYYGPNTASSLRHLSNTLFRKGQGDRQHTLDLGRMDQEAAEAENMSLMQRGRHDLERAKMDKEAYFSEPTTIGEIIKASPKFSNSLLKNMSPEDMARPTTRKEFAATMESVLSGKAQSDEKAKDRASREKIAGMKIRASDKDKKPDKDAIKLPDGTTASRDDLRSEYKMLYNIPDELDLKLMEISNDPEVKKAAQKLRAKASNAEFGKFMRRVRKEGRWWENEQEQGAAEQPGGDIALPEGVSMEDVEFTAEKHGVSVDEVMKRIMGQ